MYLGLKHSMVDPNQTILELLRFISNKKKKKEDEEEEEEDWLDSHQLLDHEVLHPRNVEDPNVACTKRSYFLSDAPFPPPPPPPPSQTVFSVPVGTPGN